MVLCCKKIFVPLTISAILLLIFHSVLVFSGLTKDFKIVSTGDELWNRDSKDQKVRTGRKLGVETAGGCRVTAKAKISWWVQYFSKRHSEPGKFSQDAG